MKATIGKYRRALVSMIREAAVTGPATICDGSISCYTTGAYAEAIWLLCADGQMELIDDTGKVLTARFKPSKTINAKQCTKGCVRK